MTWAMLITLCAVSFVLGSWTENCMTWAVRRWAIDGGTLLIRRSLFADNLLNEAFRTGFGYWLASWVPHFAWADEHGIVHQYTHKPEDKLEWQRKGLFMAWLWLWVYDGIVVLGDVIFGERVAPTGRRRIIYCPLPIGEGK